jgi:hypothetical protein
VPSTYVIGRQATKVALSSLADQCFLRLAQPSLVKFNFNIPGKRTPSATDRYGVGSFG